MINISKTAASLKPEENSATKAEKKLMDAAKMYEKQFLREMMKSMRKTVPGDGLVEKGQAEEIFQEQLDHEYVEKWGDQGGLGLHKVIYEQLMDRFGTQLGIRPRVFPQKGAISLDKAGYSLTPHTTNRIKPDDR